MAIDFFESSLLIVAIVPILCRIKNLVNWKVILEFLTNSGPGQRSIMDFFGEKKIEAKRR